jgi:hypothetical protein
MSRTEKLVSGILAFLPLAAFLVYIINFLSFFFEMMPEMSRNDHAEELILPEMFNIILFAIILGIASLGVLVYYIILVINNKLIDSTEKLVWIVIFVFVGMVGYPIYCFLRIQRNIKL